MSDNTTGRKISLTPITHHILRAYCAWMAENFEKIHLQFDFRNHDDPFLRQFMDDQGFVTLNVAPHAVGYFDILPQELRMGMRFKGVHRDLTIPMRLIRSVVGLNPSGNGVKAYAIELPFADDSSDMKNEPPPSRPTGRPHLYVVK